MNNSKHKITPAEAELERNTRIGAKDSLLGFTAYTFPNWETGEHHKVICENLEAIERGELRRLIITAPPRHSKTELAGRRFPAWYLGRNPDRQIISVSATADFAGEVGRDVRNLVASPEYHKIFETDLAPDSKAAGRWNTNKGGIYVSAGTGGQIVGRGGHVSIVDDYVKDRIEADTERFRDSIWNWYLSALYNRQMGKGAIVIIATRWHEDDLIGRCLQQDHEDWKLVKLIASTDANGEPCDPNLDDAKALWPESAYDIEEMRLRHATLTNREWEAQYQCNPQPELGIYFQREWFRRYRDVPAVNVYITSDFAVSDDGGDYTELAVWGVDEDDNLYALDWWYGQKTADVWIDALLDLIKRWKPITVWGEGGVIRRSVEPFLTKRSRERRIYAWFDWITRNADKPAMARSFQARCSMGKVYFPHKAWADRVINQCVGFPAGRYDDVVDTCALIGLALDETHAGRTPKKATNVIHTDMWGNRKKRVRNWKTA